MVRIKRIADTYYHKCVQCGCHIEYSRWGKGNCKVCKASQRLRTLNGGTDVPFEFLLAADSNFGRKVYHTRLTRPE